MSDKRRSWYPTDDADKAFERSHEPRTFGAKTPFESRSYLRLVESGGLENVTKSFFQKLKEVKSDLDFHWTKLATAQTALAEDPKYLLSPFSELSGPEQIAELTTFVQKKIANIQTDLRYFFDFLILQTPTEQKQAVDEQLGIALENVDVLGESFLLDIEGIVWGVLPLIDKTPKQE